MLNSLSKKYSDIFPDVPQLRCWFHYNQTQTGHLKTVFGTHYKRDPLGNYVAKIVSAAVYIEVTIE